MNERQLAAFRDRLRDSPKVRLGYRDPYDDSEREREFEVQDRPAKVWLAALLSDEPADLLLDVLTEEDAEWLWESVQDPDDDLTEELCRKMGLAVFAQVIDRPWYVGYRLTLSYVAEWKELDGIAAHRGLGDPLSWPVHRLLNWVEHLLLLGCEKETDRHMLLARLNAPPSYSADDMDDLPEWSDEELAADWQELAGSITNGQAAQPPRA